MVRTHPRWLRVLEMIDSGLIGEVRSVIGQFSYNNPDTHNIRNVAENGRRRADGYRLLSGFLFANDLSR
jgi:predicted dehydrogenase